MCLSVKVYLVLEQILRQITIFVSVQRKYMIFKKIVDAKKYKKEIIKAKLISTEGSVPRDSGTFMLITSKYLFGSIGGGQLEYTIIEKAKKI